MKQFFLLGLFMASLFTNCHKVVDPIPPPPPPDPVDTLVTPVDTIKHIIEFGKGSMKFNGVEWPNTFRAIAYKNYPAHFYIVSDTINSSALRKSFFLSGIASKVGKCLIEDPVGYDALLNNIPDGAYTISYEGDQPVANYVQDNTRTDQFFEIIRYDSINQIVEGRFQAYMIKTLDDTHLFPFISIPDTVSITEGKFHLKIQKP